MTTVELYNEKLQEAFNAFAGSIALHPEAYSFLLSAFDFDLVPWMRSCFAARTQIRSFGK